MIALMPGLSSTIMILSGSTDSSMGGEDRPGAGKWNEQIPPFPLRVSAQFPGRIPPGQATQRRWGLELALVRDGEFQKAVTPPEIQLGGDIGAVILNSFDAYMQDVGNLAT